MTKSRIFLWALAAFVVGVGARSFFAVPYVLILMCGIGGAAAVAAGVTRQRKKSALAGFFALAALAGVLRYEAVARAAPDLSRLYGKNFAAQGVVVEDPAARGASQRVKVKVVSVDGRVAEPHFFVLATIRRLPAYRIGDELVMKGVAERPENYGDFDYVSYLRRDGIFALMPFPKIEKVGSGKGNQLMLFLSRVKGAFEKNIDAALPEPHAAFMKGLLLGERASLPEKVVEEFKTAGVSHIVALSGYNITLVGRSLMNGLLRLTIPFLVSFWVSIAVIVLFVLMTGAAASVVRAGIMGLLVLVAQKEGRAYQMTNALAFAGAAMIFHNPYILRFDAGFQLSFLATAGLVYLSPPIGRWVERMRAKLSFSEPKLSLARSPKGNVESAEVFGLKKIFIETVSAQVMVLPLLIFLFGRVSLVSPIANLAVLTAVPYAMAVGFAAGMLGFVSSLLGTVAGWAAWAVLEYQLRAITLFAGTPFASVEIGAWTAGPMLVVYGVVFWKLWKKSKNTRV